MQGGAIIAQLQRQILLLTGSKQLPNINHAQKLPFFAGHMPNGCFPLGAVHQFSCANPEAQAASTAFIAAIQSSLFATSAVTVCISQRQTIYPPALRLFNLQPQQFIFITPKNNTQCLWATEEALQCPGVTSVITNITDCTFTQSRRLQLAVEKSSVTGFILTPQQKAAQNNACFSKWQIQQLPSQAIEGLPGVGYSQWQVNLQKIRNGKIGSWQLVWANNQLQLAASTQLAQSKKAV
jgi:protein ImuA